MTKIHDIVLAERELRERVTDMSNAELAALLREQHPSCAIQLAVLCEAMARVLSHNGDNEKPPVERKPKPQPEPEASERGYRFADWFRTTLAPDAKLGASWRESWARCFDDMVRLDKRTPEQIAAVCKWARGDSFWAQNFQTPLKLRAKKDGIQYFDSFTEKMKAGGSRSGSTAAQRNAARSTREYALKEADAPKVWNPLTDD